MRCDTKIHEQVVTNSLSHDDYSDADAAAAAADDDDDDDDAGDDVRMHGRASKDSSVRRRQCR